MAATFALFVTRQITSAYRGNAPSGLWGGEQMDSPEERDKPSTMLPGTVQKIIKPIDPHAPDTAEIAIEGAEDLYREIRVENT